MTTEGAALEVPPLPAETTEGAALAELIRSGMVAPPAVCTWNEWETWRAREGHRPAVPRHRPTFAAWQRREVDLWRSTMVAVHGERWRELLEDHELAQALERGFQQSAALAAPVARLLSAEAPVFRPAEAHAGGAVTPPRAPVAMPPTPEPARALEPPRSPEAGRSLVLAGSPGGSPGRGEDREDASSLSAGSWAGLTVDELRQRAYGDFDPTVESLSGYEGRVFRAVALLEKRGEAVIEEQLHRSVIRARYAMEVAGQEPAEAARTLRSCLARALEDGDGDDQRDARRGARGDAAGLRARAPRGRAGPHGHAAGRGLGRLTLSADARPAERAGGARAGAAGAPRVLRHGDAAGDARRGGRGRGAAAASSSVPAWCGAGHDPAGARGLAGGAPPVGGRWP